MIVAPIHQSMNGKKTVKQKIWLPEGLWYDYRNNKPVTGNGFITENYGIDEIPVFVRGGSIIPTQTAKTRITGSISDTLILTVYPPLQNENLADSDATAGYDPACSFKLYEDDGTTENYKHDSVRFTSFEYYAPDGPKIFSIIPDGGYYNGQPQERAYEIRIVNTPKPNNITIDDRKAIEQKEWSYDNSTHQLIIKTARQKIVEMHIELN